MITDSNHVYFDKLALCGFQKGVLNIRFTLIFYYVLTNLQFVLEFIRCFIIRERTLCSNEVENLLVVTVVVDVASNQLSIPYCAFHIRSALNQKIPLASYLVHLFFLPET